MASAFREIGKEYGLEDEDVKPTIMGVPGVDLNFSPAARKIMDLAIEVKNVEKLSVVSVFNSHYAKYQVGKFKDSLKLLIHKRNRQRPLVTMDFEDFLKLFRELLRFRHHSVKTKVVFEGLPADTQESHPHPFTHKGHAVPHKDCSECAAVPMEAAVGSGQ